MPACLGRKLSDLCRPQVCKDRSVSRLGCMSTTLSWLLCWKGFLSVTDSLCLWERLSLYAASDSLVTDKWSCMPDSLHIPLWQWSANAFVFLLLIVFYILFFLIPGHFVPQLPPCDNIKMMNNSHLVWFYIISLVCCLYKLKLCNARWHVVLYSMVSSEWAELSDCFYMWNEHLVISWVSFSRALIAPCSCYAWIQSLAETVYQFVCARELCIYLQLCNYLTSYWCNYIILTYLHFGNVFIFCLCNYTMITTILCYINIITLHNCYINVITLHYAYTTAITLCFCNCWYFK